MQIIAKLCINEIYELNHEWKHKIFKSQSLLVFDYLVHSNGTNKRKTLLQIINIHPSIHSHPSSDLAHLG